MRDINQAAMRYHHHGLTVVPLKGKKATVNWQGLIQGRQTAHQVNAWIIEGKFANVGIVCGEPSGNLVVIDLDGLEAVQEFYTTFPELTETYTVMTGSANGAHLYYRVSHLPSSVRTKGFELRGDGCYIVAPPSRHPETGYQYVVVRRVPILQLPRLDHVANWIDCKKESGVPVGKPGRGDKIKTPPLTTDERNRRYGAAALADQAAQVRAATPGGQNEQLNRSAFVMGLMIGEGKIDQWTVENVLFEAATQSGYVARDGERQTWATIRSGVRGGIRRAGAQ